MCLALVHNYVAQVSNLLYRRFPIGGAKDISYAPNLSQTLQAGSPAIQSRLVGRNLRYAKHVRTYAPTAIGDEVTVVSRWAQCPLL